MISTGKITINGQDYNCSFDEASGKYKATAVAPSLTSYNQPGGYYDVKATFTDTANNESIIDSSDPTFGSLLRLVVKEKVAPTINITSPGQDANIITATPTLSIQLRDEVNGSGVKIDTLALHINGGAAIGNTATGMTCAPVSGGYDVSYVVQSALSDGVNSITVDISDNDGNAAVQASRSFIVNTAAPILNLTNPSGDLLTNQSALTIEGTVNDNQLTSVTVSATVNGVDAGAITHNTTTGAFSKQINLSEGENTLVVTAVDAGGLSSSVTRKITLDTTPPVFTSVSITPNPADGGATLIILVGVTD
jgi:hypothetical protein